MHKKYNLTDFYECKNILLFLIIELKISLKENLSKKKKLKNYLNPKQFKQIFAWFSNDHSSFL